MPSWKDVRPRSETTRRQSNGATVARIEKDKGRRRHGGGRGISGRSKGDIKMTEEKVEQLRKMIEKQIAEIIVKAFPDRKTSNYDNVEGMIKKRYGEECVVTIDPVTKTLKISLPAPPALFIPFKIEIEGCDSLRRCLVGSGASTECSMTQECIDKVRNE